MSRVNPQVQDTVQRPVQPTTPDQSKNTQGAEASRSGAAQPSQAQQASSSQPPQTQNSTDAELAKSFLESFHQSTSQVQEGTKSIQENLAKMVQRSTTTLVQTSALNTVSDGIRTQSQSEEIHRTQQAEQTNQQQETNHHQRTAAQDQQREASQKFAELQRGNARSDQRSSQQQALARLRPPEGLDAQGQKNFILQRSRPTQQQVNDILPRSQQNNPKARQMAESLLQAKQLKLAYRAALQANNKQLAAQLKAALANVEARIRQLQPQLPASLVQEMKEAVGEEENTMEEAGEEAEASESQEGPNATHKQQRSQRVARQGQGQSQGDTMGGEAQESMPLPATQMTASLQQVVSAKFQALALTTGDQEEEQNLEGAMAKLALKTMVGGAGEAARRDGVDGSVEDSFVLRMARLRHEGRHPLDDEEFLHPDQDAGEGEAVFRDHFAFHGSGQLLRTDNGQVFRYQQIARMAEEQGPDAETVQIGEYQVSRQELTRIKQAVSLRMGLRARGLTPGTQEILNSGTLPAGARI